jgi:hypothetical protein
MTDFLWQLFYDFCGDVSKHDPVPMYLLTEHAAFAVASLSGNALFKIVHQ